MLFLFIIFYNSLFSKLLDSLSFMMLSRTLSKAMVLPLALVPTSSRFRTLTELVPSSSAPTTIILRDHQFKVSLYEKIQLNLPKMKLY